MKTLFLFFAILILQIKGCSSDLLGNTSICEINKNPGDFTDKTITINGRVASSYSLWRASKFDISDGDCTITVVGVSGDSPSPNSEIEVTGRVEIVYRDEQEVKLLFIQEMK
jgi:hypothetical protein